MPTGLFLFQSGLSIYEVV